MVNKYGTNTYGTNTYGKYFTETYIYTSKT